MPKSFIVHPRYTDVTFFCRPEQRYIDMLNYGKYACSYPPLITSACHSSAPEWRRVNFFWRESLYARFARRYNYLGKNKKKVLGCEKRERKLTWEVAMSWFRIIAIYCLRRVVHEVIRNTLCNTLQNYATGTILIVRAKNMYVSATTSKCHLIWFGKDREAHEYRDLRVVTFGHPNIVRKVSC